MRLTNYLICFLSTGFLFTACKQENFEITTPRIQEYFPLETGRSITYRLDSTVPARFGADTLVRSYEVKYLVDQKIKDGENRDAYRIYRQLRPLNSTAPFNTDHTFTATPVGEQQMLWMENNLRFSKLYFPIREGFSWKGNSYISSGSENLEYYDGWDYVYENVGAAITLNGKTFNNTITVHHIDEISPPGPFNPEIIKIIKYSKEIYAKDVGMIYRNTAILEWQPKSPSGQPGFWTDNSFRIILSIIDHD